jgi:hypothetical protein
MESSNERMTTPPGVHRTQIEVGELLRVPYTRDVDEDNLLLDLRTLTRGTYATALSTQPGISALGGRIRGPDDRARIPAIVLFSNPYVHGSRTSPWADVVDEDRGYALYHGDNKHPGRPAFEATGNRLLYELYPLYAEPDGRLLAPPLLLFAQAEYGGRRKGYRRFCGYGVPISYRLQTQATSEGRPFANLVMELALFRLEAEDELFDFAWIYDRRDPKLDAVAANRKAPRAWTEWVREGEAAVPRCRRQVLRRRIVPHKERVNLTSYERRLLAEVHQFFQERRHSFEGLASFVAQRVLGERCVRGWVTVRSGDGGVDFVSRLDVGSGFGQSSAVILGQAKCVAPTSSISGLDLARLVARLRRGWIGVFVTTGVFSDPAQRELIEDDYPVVLIDGKRLVQELVQAMSVEGISLADLLNREADWHERSLSRRDPARIIGIPDAGVSVFEAPVAQSLLADEAALDSSS